MANLFTVLLNTIKAKITPIWTKLKLWTSLSFIKTKVVTKIRTFFTQTLSVKPRHKKDYYSLGRWLISKKLAFAIVMVIGVASLCYIFLVNPPAIFTSATGGVKTYKYSSIPLRFTSGKVNIKAESGYVAYEGNVEKGRVTGSGVLYDPEHEVIYTGNFSDNKFNGNGKLYYPGEILHYTGNFSQNLFEGEGTLYRKDGSLEYTGSFSQGMKDGEGILFDSGSNQIYQGGFSKDHLLYPAFLGKTAEDIGKVYTGQRMVYVGPDSEFVVSLPDVSVIYSGDSNEASLDDSMQIAGIYVLENSIYLAGSESRNVNQLNNVLGTIIHEGNSQIKLAEAVAINRIVETNANSGLELVYTEKQNIYSDVINITDYDDEQTLYLYTYSYEGVEYTFFCRDRYGEFSFYYMEKIV